MFDYRALYEIQLQVSVDFLRVVQSQTAIGILRNGTEQSSPEYYLIELPDPEQISTSTEKGIIVTKMVLINVSFSFQYISV